MKNFMIYLSILMISNIYAQCDNYSQSQCSNDNNCEWVEDIETGNCGTLLGDDCELNPECNWNCDFVDDYMGWCTYSCDGGPYEIDNSYCQEMEILECSGLLTESNCNHIDECEWVEDIEIGQCSQFDNSENSCTDYPGECFWDEDITYASCDYPNSGICNSVEGCYWDCYYGYCDCYGQQQIVDTECIGQYDIDNSYCQEVQMPECSQMLEGQCDDNEDCEWVEDIQWGNCSNYNNGTACDANDNCYWDLCYGGSYGSWSHCCIGGAYQIDNGYCEEVSVEYLMGDINNDFIINILDVIEIINLILDGEHLAIVDMNYDHSVNVLDIIILVDIILNPTRL